MALTFPVRPSVLKVLLAHVPVMTRRTVRVAQPRYLGMVFLRSMASREDVSSEWRIVPIDRVVFAYSFLTRHGFVPRFKLAAVTYSTSGNKD